MVTVHYGGTEGTSFTLEYSAELVAVRTRERDVLERTAISEEARRIVSQLPERERFREAGVEVLDAGNVNRRDEVRSLLKPEPAIRFAGRVLVGEDGVEPVLYTENLFIKFAGDALDADVVALLGSLNLTIKRRLEYARNAYFVEAPEGTGLEVFDMAERLLERDDVELCHPELIRKSRRRGQFPMQWHLGPATINNVAIDAHANVVPAWAHTRGEGIVIAIIDDGVDVEHPEFARPGKVIFPRDTLFGTNNPRPGPGDNHGTACAGVACGDGSDGASGVAPGATLMPIRMVGDLGSQAEADSFQWAAEHGADIISCSWGPADGDPRNPNDPVHRRVVPLPDSTRLAMNFATTQGRGGKGCVILFAAGNGNESVDNDGYASYDRVMAIAACNDRGTRSFYSDFGKAIWCAFPSSDPVPASRVRGIWTADRRGHDGYNFGRTSLGDADGDYTNSFGGTSSACPGAAGVAALVLARNPGLRWDQVKDILRQATDQIDQAGGQYVDGRSKFYGFGRLNALKAVELAAPAQPSPTAVFVAEQDRPIADMASARLEVNVGDTRAIRGLRASVDIRHTYRGDLVVRLVPPASMGAPVVLHNRTGRGADDIVATFDPVAIPALGGLLVKNPQGAWALEVEDRARLDTGTLRKFELRLEF